MSRRCLLAIGVSTVERPESATEKFGYLDGAFVGAEYIGQWALKSGFDPDNVQVVTDRRNAATGEKNPVTSDRVKLAISNLFPDDGEIVDHFILYFCGHGLTGTMADSIFWLLSDSQTEGYKVHVGNFIDQLQDHGIKHLSVISDACRDAPKSIELQRLEPRRIITGKNKSVSSRRTDRLTACQDGEQGFMVGEKNSAHPGKCILSGVVLDVLWGLESSAIVDQKINTVQFCGYARERATARASDYKLDMNPQCWVEPFGLQLYDADMPIAPPEPEFLPWPDPDKPSVANMGEENFGIFAAATATDEVKTEAILKLIKKQQSKMVNYDTGFGISAPKININNHHEKFMKSVKSGGQSLREFAVMKDISRQITLPNQKQWSESYVKKMERQIKNNSSAVLRQQINKKSRVNIRESLKAKHVQKSNLIIGKGQAKQIWSVQTNRARKIHQRSMLKLTSSLVHNQYIIEFNDGMFAPVTMFPSLCAVLTRDKTGVPGLLYLDHKKGPNYQTAEVVLDLHGGKLSINDIEDIGQKLTQTQFRYPVLACVAAYLYDAIGDIDSIRRMAHIFVARNQAVPFDIAMLGKLKRVSKYRVELPNVDARPPEHSHDALPKLAYKKYGATRGNIAGLCPWLNMGWDHLQSARHKMYYFEGFDKFYGSTASSVFTMLNETGGKTAIDQWGYVPLLGQ